MEALLPSEVSRLILGYLEDQSCTVAYQSFLESCPHLKECAEAAKLGLRFSTRAAGKSLRDILNEYCLIYTIVQERIQKLPESSASQLKAYGVSLADQVKQLIDGKQTGQRFHVNITVPSQPKSSKLRHGGSGTNTSPGTSHHMVTPTSSRLRRSFHSIQEQRLTLRPQDLKEDVTASVTVQRVETTQLENLPGSSTTSPPRRASLSGSRDQAANSENAANDDAEEENLSLLDPKTGELITPTSHQSDLRPSSKGNASCSSVESKTVETNTSAPSALSLRQSVEPSDGARDLALNHTSSGNQAVQNESGNGRTSLDRMLMNILSAHETGDGTPFLEKSADCVSSTNVTRLRPSNSFPGTPVESGVSEPSTSQSAAPTACTSLQGQEKNVPCVLATPNPKQPPKNPNEMEITTPRRSAAKRKTKPTPLKMMTPLKIKVGGEASDSPDVKINPKLIYGPLLEKRELHERIAENINQYIRPSSSEEVTEQREVNTADASTDAVLSISNDGKGQPSKDVSTQEELERVIKSVVDKTESDPLFESLLSDILGPDCNEDSMLEAFTEDGTNQDVTSNGEHEANDTMPPEGGNKDPISILEDQNEAAIKSILEAQPLMKETPNPIQGKAPAKRKGKRVAQSKTKAVKGINSGASNPHVPDFDASVKNDGQQSDGVSAAASNENLQANGQEGPQLIILPYQDVMVPPLTYPTIILNGLPQCMVPQKPMPIPVAPKEPVLVPGNPPFILTKINPEDAKNLTIGPRENRPFPRRELPSLLPAINLTDHADTLLPLPAVDTSKIQVEPLGLGTENVADDDVTSESAVEAKETNSTCNQGATPDVLASRPSRSATEGQQKNVEKQDDTPMMATGKPRASMSTPRRKSRGHIRALDFGSTPPKPLPSASLDSSSKVMTTSTPFEAPSKLLGPSNVARKELSKCLGGPGTSELPDLSTTCIATRSPPPRLSGAWNKVGVDLIFDCEASPTSEHQSPPSQSHSAPEGSQGSPEGSKDGTKSSSVSVSPKAKLKGDAWDAALRAQIGIAEEPKKLKRDEMQAMARVEREKKRLEMQKVKDEAKRIANEAKKAAEELRKKKLEEKLAKKAKRAEARAQRNSKASARSQGQKKSLEELTMPSLHEIESSSVDENPTAERDVEERAVEKEKQASPVLLNQEAPISSKVNASNEEEVEGDQEAFGEKRKRNSWSDVLPKKKVAIEMKASLESDSPNIVPGETVTSPEKTRVVQQSPGSWANKRSLLSQSMDSGEGKFTGSFAARRCLDLHETPRKPEQSSAVERVIQKSGGSNHSTAGDRTTLTVVDTPLFPPTPGISVVGTPHREDSGEAVDTFPTYFKPREKDAPSGKEKLVEGASSENSEPLPNSQTGDAIEKDDVEKSIVALPKSKTGEPGGNDLGKSNDTLSNSKSNDAVENDVRDGENALAKSKSGEPVINDVRKSTDALSKSKVGNPVEKDVGKGGDTAEVPEKSDEDARKAASIEKSLLEENVEVEIAVTVGKKNARTKKPPAKKTPAVQGKPQEKSKKEKPNAEEEEGSDSEKEFEDEVLPTRVLRPRKKTGSYKGESPQNEVKKNDAPDIEPSKVTAKRKPAPRRRKKQPSPEPEPCTVLPEEEIAEGLVFTPLAPEVVMTQSHEAEILAKQIKLKLSPPAPKLCDFEEEEDDGDSVMAGSSPSGKIQKVADQKVDGDLANGLPKRPDSGSSDHSSSSDSSSSDSSDEGESDHDEASQNKVVASPSSEAVEKISESNKSPVKPSPKKVVGSGSVPENGHFRQLFVEEPSKSSISPAETEVAEKSDGKKLLVVHWKKGNNVEPVSSIGNKEESDKLGTSQNVKVPEMKDVSEGSLLLSEKKKRRDNLEKILFGRDSNDAEESIGIVETQSSILPIVDHSLASELETKKQRTLEKLRAGRTSRSPGASEGSGFISSPSPSKPTPKPSVAVSPNVLSITPTGKKFGSIGTRRSPRKSLPVKESSKIASMFDQEEDDDFQDECPELRLSEGEFEFDTPEKIISPGKFELLASVEDKLALLHGDVSPIALKKTARMSCTPASNTGEGLKKKKPSKAMCTDSGSVSSAPDLRSYQVGKQRQPQLELEPIPSTSKAAELRHKAEERKYRASVNAVEESNLSSGVTVRKNTARQRRSLRSHQIGKENEDLFGDDESIEINNQSSLDHENRPPNDIGEQVGEILEKNKGLKGSPKKSKEQGDLQASVVSASAKASEKDMPKCKEKNTKSGVGGKKDSAEKEAAATPPCTQPVGNSGVSTKQNRRHKKSLDDSAIVEKSKVKPSRSRRKSGHPILHCAEAGKSLLLDEDELTRDCFTENMNERLCDPGNSVTMELSFKKIPEVSKNSVLSDKLEKQKLEKTELSKEAKLGYKPQKCIVCDVPARKSSEKNVGANRRGSSPTSGRMQKSCLEPDTLGVDTVKDKLLEDAIRQVDSNPKALRRSSSKIEDMPSQAKLPSHEDGGNFAALVAPAEEVALAVSNVNKSTVMTAGKSEGAKVSGDSGNDCALSQPHSDEQELHEDVGNTMCSPHESSSSDTSEVPSADLAMSDNSEDNGGGVPDCSEAPVEEGVNNASMVAGSDMSFSSNEAYITIVYDEDNPPTSTTSILNSLLGPPLSPSAPELEGLSVELDGEIVNITKSDYIELLTITPKETKSQVCRGIRGKVISAIVSSSRKPKNDQGNEAATKKKKGDETEKNCDAKGGSSSSDRKRKQVDEVENVKGEVLLKFCQPSHRKEKEMSRRSSAHTESASDKDMASIQRVVDACNVSNENSVDDDSLMTYAAIGVCPDENQNKEDGDTKKFLPLKKRRTTADDKPSKPSGDGDVVNSNPGMFFPLNVMEIEDFLSKVHGDGS